MIFDDDYVTPRFREGRSVELRFARTIEPGRKTLECFEVRGGGAYAGLAITVEQAAEFFGVCDTRNDR